MAWQLAAGTAQDAILSCATLAISVLSAPVMLRAIRALTDGRAIDSLEEQVSVGYLAAMLLCGGGRMMLFGVNVGVAGAALVTVCMALFLGVGAGSVAGMVSGVTLALQGLPLALSVALGLGGFLAGMVQGLKRRGVSCLCFALGCELVLLLCHASGGGSALAAIVTPAAAALMRRGTAERLQAFFRRFHAEDAAAGDAYAAAALTAWERIVQAMAEAVPNPLECAETRGRGLVAEPAVRRLPRCGELRLSGDGAGRAADGGASTRRGRRRTKPGRGRWTACAGWAAAGCIICGSGWTRSGRRTRHPGRSRARRCTSGRCW